MVGDDLCRIKEESTLRLVQKAVLSTQCIFLGHSGNRKRLTGKPSQKHIVLRHEFWLLGKFADISSDRVIIRVIVGVRFLAVFVPFGCENASATNTLEAFP